MLFSLCYEARSWWVQLLHWRIVQSCSGSGVESDDSLLSLGGDRPEMLSAEEQAKRAARFARFAADEANSSSGTETRVPSSATDTVKGKSSMVEKDYFRLTAAADR